MSSSPLWSVPPSNSQQYARWRHYTVLSHSDWIQVEAQFQQAGNNGESNVDRSTSISWILPRIGRLQPNLGCPSDHVNVIVKLDHFFNTFQWTASRTQCLQVTASNTWLWGRHARILKGDLCACARYHWSLYLEGRYFACAGIALLKRTKMVASMEAWTGGAMYGLHIFKVYSRLVCSGLGGLGALKLCR